MNSKSQFFSQMKLISNSNFGKSNLLFYLLLVKEQYYINENPLKEK